MGTARILYADDVEAHVDYVRNLLEKEGFDVVVARDGVEALEKVRETNPDIVLLDVLMPRMNGLEACRIIKASLSKDGFLPIILVTVKSDIESKVQGLKLADDYLTRPFDAAELLARVDAMLRIKALQDSIRESKQELEELSVTDRVTGLNNHRYLQRRLRDEFKRAERYSDPLSCLVVDIDHFRDINERHERDFANHVLAETARILEDSVRDIDVTTRSGGDEFTMLLPNTHVTGSLAVAERVWRAIAEKPFSLNGAEEKVTVSIGISFYPNRDVRTKDELLRTAHKALDQAKQEGRNKICLYQHYNYFFNPGS